MYVWLMVHRVEANTDTFRVLLDCDGVLADFMRGAFNLIEQHTGVRHTVDEVVEFDMFKALGVPHLMNELKKAVTDSAWCWNLDPIPGARRFIDELRSIGRVVVTTAPLSVDGWVDQRIAWLASEMDVARRDIIFADDKTIVTGDVLIDDRAENVFAWAEANPRSHAILLDMPYNRNVFLPQNASRAMSFADALDLVRDIAQSKKEN